MKRILIVAALLYATAAVAQHAHGDKGPNGGMMEDVAGVHAELVTSGNSVTIHIFDEHSKPVATKGFTGSMLVVAGSERETITLQPHGENALKGETKKAGAKGTSYTLMLKTDSGKAGQARFRL